MTDRTPDDPAAEDRDAVLMAFSAECPDPSAAQVLAWQARHPGMAAEIADFAIGLMELSLRGGLGPAREPIEAEYAESWRLHEKNAANIEAGRRAERRLNEIVVAAGSTIADVADAIDIKRDCLLRLETGLVTLPVSRRLVDAIARSIAVAPELIARGLECSYRAPSIGHAYASGRPTISRQTYAEMIGSSGMPEERRVFWLGGD